MTTESPKGRPTFNQTGRSVGSDGHVPERWRGSVAVEFEVQDQDMVAGSASWLKWTRAHFSRVSHAARRSRSTPIDLGEAAFPRFGEGVAISPEAAMVRRPASRERAVIPVARRDPMRGDSLRDANRVQVDIRIGVVRPRNLTVTYDTRACIRRVSVDLAAD